MLRTFLFGKKKDTFLEPVSYFFLVENIEFLEDGVWTSYFDNTCWKPRIGWDAHYNYYNVGEWAESRYWSSVPSPVNPINFDLRLEAIGEWAHEYRPEKMRVTLKEVSFIVSLSLSNIDGNSYLYEMPYASLQESEIQNQDKDIFSLSFVNGDYW